jgi:hypothetical protein
MSGYSLAYVAAWVCTLVSIISGAIVAASASGSNLGLTDVQIAWLGVAITISAGVGALLPSVRATPAAHEDHKQAIALGEALSTGRVETVTTETAAAGGAPVVERVTTETSTTPKVPDA